MNLFTTLRYEIYEGEQVAKMAHVLRPIVEEPMDPHVHYVISTHS